MAATARQHCIRCSATSTDHWWRGPCGNTNALQVTGRGRVSSSRRSRRRVRIYSHTGKGELSAGSPDGSCVRRESHAQFYERPGVQFLRPTHHRFVSGRPAWERVGAQFVDDVRPYEAMKLRLLNASHLAVAGLGQLAGFTYVQETMEEPALRAYMAALMDRETGPTLPRVPGIDLSEYKRTLIERFANSAIQDTVER